MKYVVTFAISGLHNTCLPKKKPFNPILGEVRDLEHSFRPHRRNLCAKLHAQQQTQHKYASQTYAYRKYHGDLWANVYQTPHPSSDVRGQVSRRH